MPKQAQEIGFAYFTSHEFQIDRHVNEWMKAIHIIGSSVVILHSAFDRAISEDIFQSAIENNLSPIVHFPDELPLARNFNDAAFLLDIYAKWGVSHVILGDRPNSKEAWPKAGWHYENIVDHFLDRFIPLANHAVRNDMIPIMSPLMPGGDYWDTAFIELVLTGLKRRQLGNILDNLMLSSYGFTYNKPISWGRGGPEQWSSTKPYGTPEGQEDQIGFHNFEWIQAVGERAIGKKLPMIILDAGHTSLTSSQDDGRISIEYMKTIYELCVSTPSNEDSQASPVTLDDTVCWCTFSLDTINNAVGDPVSLDLFAQLFNEAKGKEFVSKPDNQSKMISHYLLLPSYTSGVSDAVLNKVRPLIKHFHPTVGFSIDEAMYARKVSVYPDPILFSDETLNQLRSTGTIVEILPESGIEIATIIQNS